MDVKEKKMEESFKYHIPEDIPANERTAFHGAAAAAAKAGKKNFNFGGKTHPVTMKKDTANKIADQKEAVKYPHMMYDPKTGKEVTAKTPMDHAKFAKMGYTHEKPQMKKESIGKTAGDKSYFHLQRAKELAKKDGHDYDKLPQYDRTSNKHKDHYHDMAKKESVKKESTMTFREKLMSLYEGDRAAHYKGATKPEEYDEKQKSSKGAMDMLKTPKSVEADGMKAAKDTAANIAEKKMKKSKKRSGGDNLDKGDINIVPGATPIKDPTAKMESTIDKYGIFGKTMDQLLNAVNEVVGEKKTEEGSIKGSGTDRKAILKRAFRAGEKQDQARGSKPAIRAPKGMKGRTSRGSMDAFSAKHKDKGIEKAYKAGFHGDYSGNAPDRGKARMKPQSNFPLNKDQMKARKRMRGK